MLNKIKAVLGKETLNEDGFSLQVKTALSRAKRRSSVYLGHSKALTETIFGHSFTVNTDDVSLAPHLLTKGYWEIWITNFFLNTLSEGMTVLEIGSNIGYYTVLAASEVGSSGTVYSFEADVNNYQILHRNVELNGFLERVHLVNKAVLDEAKTVRFHKLKSHHGSNSIIDFSEEFLSKYMDESTVSIVEAVSMDTFFKEEYPKVNLVKIDAEGSEPKIFKGMNQFLARNSRIKVICEFAPNLIAQAGESPSKFLRYLSQDLSFKLNIINTSGKAVSITEDEILSFPHCELYLER